MVGLSIFINGTCVNLIFEVENQKGGQEKAREGLLVLKNMMNTIIRTLMPIKKGTSSRDHRASSAE